MSNVGELIKQRREATGLSQKRLGTACGVSDSEIMKIESGQRKSPNWNTLCKIAHTLNFHPFEILLTAKYITKDDINPNTQIHGLDELDDHEIASVQQFIDFIIMQKNTSAKERT